MLLPIAALHLSLFLLKGGDSIGKLEAGLPNIQGQLRVVLLDNPGTAAGAFVNMGGNNANAAVGNGAYGRYSIDFNAANSNSLYGNSTTVQPPAFALVLQIKF